MSRLWNMLFSLSLLLAAGRMGRAATTFYKFRADCDLSFEWHSSN